MIYSVVFKCAKIFRTHDILNPSITFAKPYSFLSTCLYKECLSIDIGANIGQFSIMMAALGSRHRCRRTIALATALERSAEVNCFGDRLTVHNAYIS